MGRDTPVDITIRYGLDICGSNSGWKGGYFPLHPDRLSVKRPGVDLTTHASNAEEKESVELYFYSSSGPSWQVIKRTLSFFVRTLMRCLYLRKCYGFLGLFKRCRGSFLLHVVTERETSLTSKISNTTGGIITRKIRCRFWTAGSTPVRGMAYVYIHLCNVPLPIKNLRFQTFIISYNSEYKIGLHPWQLNVDIWLFLVLHSTVVLVMTQANW